MKKLFLAAALGVLLTGRTQADQGCIDEFSVATEISVCNELACLKKDRGGSCTIWACTNTQTTKHTDTAAGGCTRYWNCGANAVFSPGAPDEPSIETNEVCDWYPCVQQDPARHNCVAYSCVSKRVVTTRHITYSKAKCEAPGQTAKPAAPPKPAEKPVLKSWSPKL